jgi:hypothetical protein
VVELDDHPINGLVEWRVSLNRKLGADSLVIELSNTFAETTHDWGGRMRVIPCSYCGCCTASTCGNKGIQSSMRPRVVV